MKTARGVNLYSTYSSSSKDGAGDGILPGVFETDEDVEFVTLLVGVFLRLAGLGGTTGFTCGVLEGVVTVD